MLPEPEPKGPGAGWGVVSPGVASGHSSRFEFELCHSREMRSFLPLHFNVCKRGLMVPLSGCGRAAQVSTEVGQGQESLQT